MDGQRFDELTRGLAAGLSRRRVVKGIAGGVAAGAAALLGRADVDARRVTQAYCGNQVCAGDPTACPEDCGCCLFANGNSRCMPPKSCRQHGGVVEGDCEENETWCGVECADTLWDSQHCGDCDTACGQNQACSWGGCYDTCDISADCGPDQICARGLCSQFQGTCPTGANFCANLDDGECNGSIGCTCFETTAGKTFCGNNSIGGAPCQTCTVDSDCGDGRACVVLDGNCSGSVCETTGTNICVFACPILS